MPFPFRDISGLFWRTTRAIADGQRALEDTREIELKRAYLYFSRNLMEEVRAFISAQDWAKECTITKSVHNATGQENPCLNLVHKGNGKAVTLYPQLEDVSIYRYMGGEVPVSMMHAARLSIVSATGRKSILAFTHAAIMRGAKAGNSILWFYQKHRLLSKLRQQLQVSAPSRRALPQQPPAPTGRDPQ